jgi:hypothetical protein
MAAAAAVVCLFRQAIEQTRYRKKVDRCCNGKRDHRRSEWVPKTCGSSPMLAIHSETSRAYCLVVMLRSEPFRPLNMK